MEAFASCSSGMKGTSVMRFPRYEVWEKDPSHLMDYILRFGTIVEGHENFNSSNSTSLVLGEEKDTTSSTGEKTPLSRWPALIFRIGDTRSKGDDDSAGSARSDVPNASSENPPPAGEVVKISKKDYHINVNEDGCNLEGGSVESSCEKGEASRCGDLDKKTTIVPHKDNTQKQSSSASCTSKRTPKQITTTSPSQLNKIYFFSPDLAAIRAELRRRLGNLNAKLLDQVLVPRVASRLLAALRTLGKELVTLMTSLGGKGRSFGESRWLVMDAAERRKSRLKQSKPKKKTRQQGNLRSHSGPPSRGGQKRPGSSTRKGDDEIIGDTTTKTTSTMLVDRKCTERLLEPDMKRKKQDNDRESIC
ncbi:unnamed protein product [Amoebophrya sp. A25]|nr:unnamed protein product [Amoebophrya sp. A25]|eukprot:GSA25T00003117001.1